MKHLNFLSIAACVISFTNGCARSVNAPKEALNECKAEQKVGVPASIGRDPEQQAIDMNAEADIAEKCQTAWHAALAGDGKAAIGIMDNLEKKYPNVSTVHLMKGQVLEKLGKKTEAIKAYQQSVTNSEFSSMHLFKLAEALRTSGDAKGAILRYRRLMEMAPGFVPAKVGLAESLFMVDPHSSEARKEATEVIAAEPDNIQAKALLTKMKGK